MFLFIFMHAAGPIVDSTMTLSILSSRDADGDIMFRLSFNISFGLPSHIRCTRDSINILGGFGGPGRGIVSGAGMGSSTDLST